MMSAHFCLSSGLDLKQSRRGERLPDKPNDHLPCYCIKPTRYIRLFFKDEKLSFFLRRGHLLLFTYNGASKIQVDCAGFIPSIQHGKMMKPFSLPSTLSSSKSFEGHTWILALEVAGV